MGHRLATSGHEVRALDDLSAGDSGRLDPKVLFTRADVNDTPKLWTLLQGVDCVYHLAARVSVPESILYPREYNATNVGGTVSLLEAMRAVGVGRLVFSSSGAVYGEQEKQPLQEDFTPDPRSPYAVSKLAAEYYVRTCGMLWGIEAVSLRIFNAYGAWQQLPAAHPPVIPQFIRHAQRGGSIIIHGDGRQTRDYIYIDDVVDALVAASTALHVDREVINIGSGAETSVNDLVREIGIVLGKDVQPLHSATQSGGVSHMRAGLEKARQLLNFTPKITLAEGLRRTVILDSRFQG
ncbi:MAG TPA: NAD-dependent epimerase/dehydratase family protein [Aggregatilineales bacterium]|nr:NAD-dependent epimerase/dehydratase family protein [Aggregatilineales bacterium]